MNVATQLHDARRRAGLTQAELASRVGTSQATLSAYENGHKQPSVETLGRTARSLIDVLALAEALPTRHERELRFPRLQPPEGLST